MPLLRTCLSGLTNGIDVG